MTISFARYQFPPAVIRHAVWLYVRFTLSYRDVEDLLAEHGLNVPYETVWRWVLKLAPPRIPQHAAHPPRGGVPDVASRDYRLTRNRTSKIYRRSI
jgi:hypothetical protein